MAAYVVAQIEVTDADAFAKYGAKVPETIARYGGRYKVRGGASTAMEGEQPYPRVVVIEFDDVEAAKRWYNSPEYAPLIAMRQAASRGSLQIVEGV